MKHLISFCIVLLVFVRLGYSQTFELGIESGIATFDMSDLKDKNNSLQKQLPFKTEMTYNFPAYVYYKPQALLNFKRFSVGVSLSFQSTGSRLSRLDYSGEYVYDMLIKSWSLGFEGAAVLFAKNNHNIQLALGAGMVLTDFNSKGHLTLYDSVLVNNEASLDGKNMYVIPSVRYSYSLKSLKFGVNAGYFRQFWNNPFFIQDYKLSIKPNWSGFRLGVFVSYVFKSVND